jgi:UDP-glucose 4-epimerase
MPRRVVKASGENPPRSTMRYLVTGGAGFIGSHLSHALLERGDTVTILDNLSTGRIGNLESVQERLSFVRGSVLDPLLVDELTEDADVVIHLAAAVGVRLIVEKPLRSFITNIKGTENVLEAAHRYRCKVLIASTSEVYGKSQGGAFKEDDDRLVGSNHISRWGYATSKSVDEVLGFAYARERDLRMVVARFFNTTGPRQTGAYGMVLPRFVEQALRNDPLTVYGDGGQSRCFCHVEDVVRGVLGLMDEPSAEGDVFNIGSTEEVTVMELAQRVIAKAESSSEIELVPYEIAYTEGFEDMRRRVPDISKIGSQIGWKPEHDLDQIIDEVLKEMSG